ncbi:MAG: hypothetical protein IJ565_00090 [Bacilli bacterium]|nr:hypothetical protein [Bacilli bacterium]
MRKYYRVGLEDNVKPKRIINYKRAYRTQSIIDSSYLILGEYKKIFPIYGVMEDSILTELTTGIPLSDDSFYVTNNKNSMKCKVVEEVDILEVKNNMIQISKSGYMKEYRKLIEKTYNIQQVKELREKIKKI